MRSRAKGNFSILGRENASSIDDAAWAELVSQFPAEPTYRARLAAAYLRAREPQLAWEQVEACLALCPPGSRKRLLVVVLRQRIRVALRACR